MMVLSLVHRSARTHSRAARVSSRSWTQQEDRPGTHEVQALELMRRVWAAISEVVSCTHKMQSCYSELHDLL